MMTSTPSRPMRRSGSPANALSASASSTSGTPARSSSPCTKAAVPGRLAEAGTHRDDVRLDLEHAIERGVVDRARRRLVERLGHVLRRHRGHDRQARPRRGDRHQPGAGAQGADRRQVRRARSAERSRDDEHAAEVPFVRVRGARRHQLAHALAREQLDVGAARLRRGPEAESRCRR